MPLDESDASYLWDMVRHAQIVMRLVSGMNKESYLQDERTRYAVERLIEIIGEAANSVSDNALTLAPNLPWKKIIGQRHILAHHYGTIDHERLWNLAYELIPQLVQELDAILSRKPPTS
jgi:uncharacterized protein with HEPN domain